MTTRVRGLGRISTRCDFSHVRRQRQQQQFCIQPFSSVPSVRTLSSPATSSSSILPTKPSDKPATTPHPHPEPPSSLNPAELSIFTKLRTHFMPSKLSVEDISGGCGSMYALEIESAHFKGQSLVKQQRMVNEVLKEDMEKNNWHGVRIKTGVGR